MKLAIIGAAGFIGRRLGSLGVATGAEACGHDIASPGERSEFPLHVADLAHRAPALERGTDVVFYLAQSPHYRDFPMGADDLFAVNVTGALRAAIAAREAGARFFCYASTGSVYSPSFAPIAEDHPIQRDTGYALSKLTAEDALRLMTISSTTMRVTSVRLFGVYGPGQRGMLVPTIAARVRSGAAVQIERHPHDPEDRDGLRISLTYVDDVARALLALAQAAVAGRSLPPVVNVAAPDAVSIRTLATTIGRAIGGESTFQQVDRARRLDLIADIRLLQSIAALSWTAFEDGIERTVAADA